MDLSNNVVIQKCDKGFNYLQFKRLLEHGINHAYILKPHRFMSRYGKDSQEKCNEAVENYKNFCKVINIDEDKLIKPNQTHTNIVDVVEKAPNGIRIEDVENYKDVDGLITNVKGVSLATTNADCILLLMYDPVKKVIANVHSGWRGTYAKIAENCVKKMVIQYNCNPKDIIVCISPAIRKCHFVVKDDVKKMCEDIFGYTNRLDEIIEYIGKNEEGKDEYKIDNILITKILLTQCGILEENIEDCGICSVCNSELVNSYRKDGEDFGLSAAIISL